MIFKFLPLSGIVELEICSVLQQVDMGTKLYVKRG